MRAPGPWIIGDLQQRRKRVDSSVARLPVSPVFSSRAEPPAALDGVNYFVVCGAIEPRKNLRRKNLLTLLNVWRVLTRDAAPPTFFAKIDDSHRAIIKRASTRTRIAPPARRAHYFFSPNESPSARTTREVRGFI